jgi:hypothetical protein
MKQIVAGELHRIVDDPELQHLIRKDLPVQRYPCQFDCAVDAQLGLEVFAVAAYGFVAEMHLFGYFLAGMTGGE